MAVAVYLSLQRIAHPPEVYFDAFSKKTAARPSTQAMAGEEVEIGRTFFDTVEHRARVADLRCLVS